MFLIDRILSRFFKESGIFFINIKALVGFSPKNIRYYKEAFTYPNGRKGLGSYQRLEFLGDAVLSAVISHYLFEAFEESNEGALTQLRSKIVRREALNRLGEELRLISFLKHKQQQLNKNINGNLFEALVGAIYLDRGYDKATLFIYNTVLSKENLLRLESEIISYKSILIEWGQKQKQAVYFETEEFSVNEKNDRKFLCKLWADNGFEAKAQASSKRKAEEEAARCFFYKYKIKNDMPNLPLKGYFVAKK